MVRDLDGLPRAEARLPQAGDGTGYHGMRHFEGVALEALLARHGIEPDPATGILLSARDGYRVLLSSAEVFDAPAGREVLLADRQEGEPLGEDGRFQLVPVDDQSADRWLKGVARIDVVRARGGL